MQREVLLNVYFYVSFNQSVLVLLKEGQYTCLNLKVDLNGMSYTDDGIPCRLAEMQYYIRAWQALIDSCLVL